MCRQQPKIEEAVAALANACVLRAQDRAEARAASVAASLSILGVLSTDCLKRFVVFLSRLSRTAKVIMKTASALGSFPYIVC